MDWIVYIWIWKEGTGAHTQDCQITVIRDSPQEWRQLSLVSQADSHKSPQGGMDDELG